MTGSQTTVHERASIVGHGVSALFFLLVASWVLFELGGLSWDVPRVFNGHPLFMAAFVCLFAHSVLIYRSSPFENRATRKWWHMVLHGAAFSCAVTGLCFVFQSHNAAIPPIPNLCE